MNYRVTLFKHVQGKEGWADLEFDLELPFVPFPGLEIIVAPEAGESERIERVLWDMAEKSFACTTPQDRAPEGSLDEIAAFYVADGWRETERHLRLEGAAQVPGAK